MKQNTINNAPERVAYSLREFAAKVGRDRGWVYRMVSQKKIRAITGYGSMMIPATEIERIFGKEVES